MLISDKPNLSYADFHHEITRGSNDAVPKDVASQQSQLSEGVTLKQEEVVRYMSNLPSYLENGKNFQDKPLNMGVLDWKLLEKWRYSQKQMGHNLNGYSPSSSNTSLFSSDGSSTHSSIGKSSSPVHQRTHRVTLQAPQGASPKEGYVHEAKSFFSRGHRGSPVRQRMPNARTQSHPQKISVGGRNSHEFVFEGNSEKFQGSTVSMHNQLNGQQKVCGALPLYQESDMKLISELGQRPFSDKYEVMAPWKGKTKLEGCESTKLTQTLQENEVEAVDQDPFRREKSGVMVMPFDQLDNSCSGVASSAFEVNKQLSEEVDQTILKKPPYFESSLPSKFDTNKYLEPTGSSQCAQSVKPSSNASHISLHSSKNKVVDSPSRIGVQGVKGPSETPHMLSFPSRMLRSPSRNRKMEEKKPSSGIGNASTGKSSENLNVRNDTNSIPRVRHPSPIRRLGSAMGKMIKGSGSRDNSPLRSRSSSKDCVAKSDPNGSIASGSTDSYYRDRSCSNNRGRSSPLRRLLDPLLKPRVSNSSEPSKKNSSSVVGSMKSCNGQLDFSNGQSMQANSRSPSDSHHSSKSESSSLQALLQVSFKNGFPLFTFAIDNENDILAATVRKSFVPGKGLHIWTYTFFNVHEIKRKSGIWLNHGGKNDAHGYVPNVVAQMKVSDSQDSLLNGDGDITREFDLFAVDVGDHCTTDFHPTNELAAIIVKLPGIPQENPSKDGQSSYSWLDISQASKENLLETQSCARSNDDMQNHHSVGSRHSSTTVILPGGVHTVPSKGEMSTLAQRWRSGGSCDCGGWDLGCQLRVYTNQKDCATKMGSSVTCVSEDKFRLFSLVGQDKQPMLSLAPFKDRIYSIEFNSSLSLLQAFAICISFIDCRRPVELSQPSHFVEKIPGEQGVYEVSIPTKTSDHQVSAPGRYVSYPPHSPVGRV